jgi:hypothetical protein
MQRGKDAKPQRREDFTAEKQRSRETEIKIKRLNAKLQRGNEAKPQGRTDFTAEWQRNRGA